MFASKKHGRYGLALRLVFIVSKASNCSSQCN